MTDDRLSAFLDDELEPDERAAVDARLAASPELRSELARAAEARDLVRGLPPVDPPVPLVPAAVPAVGAGPVVDELAERRRRRAPRWVAAAAAAAVLVVFAVVVWPSNGGSSLDVDALAANHVAMMDEGPTATSDPMPMDEAAAYGPDAAGGWSMAAAYLEPGEVVHLVYGRADDPAMVSVYRVAGGMPGDGPGGGEMMDVDGGPTWHGERQGMPVLVAERDGTVFTVVGPASDDDMLALVESMPT